MHLRAVVASLIVVAVTAAGCGDDGEAGPPGSTSTSSTTTASTTSTTSTSSTTTTEAPQPACATEATLAVVDDTLERARLATGDGWSSATAGSPFTERTATGEEYADRLGLDCGITAAQTVGDAERLVIAAWTGPRIAFTVQSGDGPSTPFRREAMVTVVIDATEGEFLDADQTLWAGTFDSGETFVVGHIDYSLGAAAKEWVAGPRVPSDEEITLDSERHAIAALEEAEMRNVGLAQPPPFGSEEGYVQFVSPAGQILVADVAPTGWFDPMLPRYFGGETRVDTIAGVDVRVTDPAEGDNLGYTRGAEYGWACTGFVWLLQPPFNGDADEMRSSVEAVLSTEECAPGAGATN